MTDDTSEKLGRMAEHMLGIKIDPELEKKGVGLAINKLHLIKRDKKPWWKFWQI